MRTSPEEERRYLDLLELQLAEPQEIGPAEVHTLGSPEYATMPRSVWVETCNRCVNNELRAARLQDKVDGLHLQIQAHEVVQAAKDAEYDELEARCEALEERLSEWAGAGMAFSLWCVAALLAKIAGCL